MSKFEVPEFDKMAKNVIKETARMAATESIIFFKDSFVKEGFTDTSFQAWKKTSNPMAGKKTLYRSGTLMQSIRKVEETIKRIVVESDTNYSEIHNSGGTIAVTVQMKKFWWAKYYEFSGKVKSTTKGKISKSQSNLKTNDKAEFCKRMALMKVGTKIKIPKTQFMGDSKTMMIKFENFYNEIIVKELERKQNM